jgi:hypothetical protein
MIPKPINERASIVGNNLNIYRSLACLRVCCDDEDITVRCVEW